jgi:L-alanine-DL-glutamate epimerase-like enolase superfamily enzyme
MALSGSERTRIREIKARAYKIPTDKPEADGTFAWDSTTLIVVHASGGGKTGLGYTYTDACITSLITGKLQQALSGAQADAMDPPAAWLTMQNAVRNMGHPGLTATAIAAVDGALWDLKAKLLDLPLCLLLGRYRDTCLVYGSGGFTTYTETELREQLSGWAERDGCRWVKMKIGTHPEQDPSRVAAAKNAIGERTLFVDANGAYKTKQALALADVFAREAQVGWFEEPVSSDDLEGLQAIRARAPVTMEIAAGEYGYTVGYFRRMLNAKAVDVIQADITRCGGVTGWLQVAALSAAHHIDLSGHCAPAYHLHAACAAPHFRHLEWFHDHVRIEHMLFDGAPRVRDGAIAPDLTRPGMGLEFKQKDAEQYAVKLR